MPFEPLDTVPRDSRRPMAAVSYQRSSKKSGAMPILRVSIPTTLAGLCKRERFALDGGTGADAGRARISGLAKGAVTKGAPATFLRHALVIRFGYVPGLGEDAAAKDNVGVRKIDDNTWEIDLPSWFKIEPPAAKRKAGS